MRPRANDRFLRWFRAHLILSFGATLALFIARPPETPWPPFVAALGLVVQLMLAATIGRGRGRFARLLLVPIYLLVLAGATLVGLELLADIGPPRRAWAPALASIAGALCFTRAMLALALERRDAPG